MRYSDFDQSRDYRRAAREEGCICPDSLGPHTHRPGCPVQPRSVAWWADYLEHLEQEHADDAV